MSTAFPQYRPSAAPSNVADGAYTNPTPVLDVSPQQRERAESYLQEAYAEGRLTHAEFEDRIDQVMGAQNRRDLNAAFYGLVQVPASSQALGLHPAYHPTLVSQRTTEKTGKAMAAVSHFSVFFLWIFGPMLMYMLGTKGSYAKREAAKAFNFQLYSFIGVVGVGALDTVTGGHVGWAAGLGTVLWFILTIMGGVKASQGEQWTNPVNKAIRWEPLDERG